MSRQRWTPLDVQGWRDHQPVARDEATEVIVLVQIVGKDNPSGGIGVPRRAHVCSMAPSRIP
jgi:hypothetical protein